MCPTCGNWRVWVAVVVSLAACTPAHAFYWPNWPGSLRRVEPTIINPPDLNKPGNPPLGPQPNPEPGLPETNIPPVVVNKPPVGPPAPEPTPEPSTGLIGLLGLGAVAAVRKWWRKKVCS
ncbi:MAG: PEP-CTERM sorting domain-containing protein [Planctomycetia bacterium]|nr:PEP-CTERM sorting domain-containing protein [Planctomycetia bacterium]